jgi:zinc protease
MPGKTVDHLDKALVREIGLLRRQLVGTRELEKAKNQLESAFVFGQDSLFSQAMVLATHEITSSWKDADRYIPAIRAVSAEDVRRVAKKYLTADNCTTAVLLPTHPTRKKPPQPGSAAMQKIIR